MNKHRALLLFSFALLIALAGCGTNEADVLPTEQPLSEPTDAPAATPEEMESAPSTAESEGESGETAAYPGPAGEGESGEAGYPAPESAAPADEGYPGAAQERLAEPPDPERTLPEPDDGTATLGGVLVQAFTEGGYLPLKPYRLILGEVIRSEQGNVAYIRENDASPVAEMLPTGVFIIEDVQPGTYGLIIDLGFTQFPVRNLDGSDLLFELEAGEVLDVGQVLVRMPGE